MVCKMSSGGAVVLAMVVMVPTIAQKPDEREPPPSQTVTSPRPGTLQPLDLRSLWNSPTLIERITAKADLERAPRGDGLLPGARLQDGDPEVSHIAVAVLIAVLIIFVATKAFSGGNEIR